MFRMKLSPASRRADQSAAAALKTLGCFSIALAGLLLMVGWFAWHGGRKPEEPDMGPILVSMQKIGQLHTARMNFQEVLHQASERQPEGWLRDLPGANEIARWATHNEALVTAEGSVEAGIDLSRLSEQDVARIAQPDGTTRLRVHLPAVSLYPPNVKVRVENTNPGPFWRDENIVPKAEVEARRRFLQAAEKQQIRARAQENAIQTLTQMQRALGHDRIEFTF